jgi:hypothetical protein
MVEVILVSDDESDSDGIDSLIAELFPPPHHEVVEIGHFSFYLEPASSSIVKPASSSIVKPASSSNVKPASSFIVKPASSSNVKPASSSIVKPKRKVVWRVALGTANGRDTRDTKRHRKRIVNSNGRQYIEYVLTW